MNDEPIPINPETLPEVDIQYVDKIIKLVDGSMLIARLLMLEEGADPIDLYVHSPMEIWYDYEENVELHAWIKHSDDLVYTIPIMNVVNISTPERLLGIKYANGFTFEGDEHSDFTTDLTVPDVVH